jgi:O-antigen ligase
LFGAAALVLGVCLFGDCAWMRRSRVAGGLLAEVNAVFRDPGAQWMVVACCGVYLGTFGYLRRRKKLGVRRWKIGAEWWSVGLVVFAALGYGLHYEQAAKSTQALALFGAMVLGQGVALWAGWRKKLGVRSSELGVEAENWNSEIGKLEIGNQKSENAQEEGSSPPAQASIFCLRTSLLLAALVGLLVCAAVYHGEGMREFRYRDQMRWTGPWENPNVFGLLMGLGVVLAVGGALRKAHGARREARATGRRGKSGERRAESVFRVACCLLWLAAAAVLVYGLLKSYSRGAWVGTALGIVYLLISAFKNPISTFSPVRVFRVFRGHRSLPAAPNSYLRSPNFFFSAVFVLSLCVVAFWAMQGVEGTLGRRAVSVANANDFSWRNRVAAWEGALQMMSERPWLGFGWNQPERVYDQLYRPNWLPEGGAFQLNDYMTLGTSVGVGALLCFLVYVGLALRRSEDSAETGDAPISAFQRFSVSAFPPSAVCRAGALVLLVGFWFDGGLFKLALAAPFWILLELGREDHEEKQEEENREIREKREEKSTGGSVVRGLGSGVWGLGSGVWGLGSGVWGLPSLFRVFRVFRGFPH